MRTVFDNHTREELVTRVNSVKEGCHAQWGKMNVSQMLKHCIKWDDMMLGKIRVKQMFLGKIFGRSALKNVLKNDNPLAKNSPSAPELIVKEKAGDIALLKTEWIKRIREYEYFDNHKFIHPFFGAMTKGQVGQFVYKHHDHHLRQFGL